MEQTNGSNTSTERNMSEGHYRAVLENPKIAVSKGDKSTPCFSATVRITEDGPHKNRRMPWEGWLTESAGERSIQSMIYAGCIFPEDPSTGEPNLTDFSGCGSQEVDAVVRIEEYTPEPTDSNPNPRTSKRPRVDFINPIGQSFSTKEIDKDQQTLIARNFGGLAKSVKEKKSKKASGDTSFDPNKIEAESGKKLY